MHSLKSIKLYFFSILKLFFLNSKNYYYKSSFYNKKLITFIPDRIFYNPSSFLSASLTSISNDFYKITDTSVDILWKTDNKEKRKLDCLTKLKKNFSLYNLLDPSRVISVLDTQAMILFAAISIFQVWGLKL